MDTNWPATAIKHHSFLAKGFGLQGGARAKKHKCLVKMMTIKIWDVLRSRVVKNSVKLITHFERKSGGLMSKHCCPLLSEIQTYNFRNCIDTQVIKKNPTL